VTEGEGRREVEGERENEGEICREGKKVRQEDGRDRQTQKKRPFMYLLYRGA
jgi:hypothetical protein